MGSMRNWAERVKMIFWAADMNLKQRNFQIQTEVSTFSQKQKFGISFEQI
jgi:hypothetical protein